MKDSLNYTIIIQKVEEGGYIASVPLLPGCLTQGETFEEVQENIKDAIIGYLEVLKEDGEEIPIEFEQPISAHVNIFLPA